MGDFVCEMRKPSLIFDIVTRCLKVKYRTSFSKVSLVPPSIHFQYHLSSLGEVEPIPALRSGYTQDWSPANYRYHRFEILYQMVKKCKTMLTPILRGSTYMVDVHPKCAIVYYFQ